MKTNNPRSKLVRVVLTAQDREAGTSRSTTIYEASPQEVLDICIRALKREEKRRERQSVAVPA
jgi:hypothetical protein